SGLSADDITITPAGALTKGALGGSGGTYTLAVSGISAETEITVAVSKTGYTITPSSKTVTVHKTPVAVSFDTLTANGAANTTATTELTLGFSAAISGLSAGNITITPAGAVVKGPVSGSGGTYKLSLSGVSAESEIEVTVAKSGYTITPSSKTVAVHKAPVPVSFTGLTANGAANTTTTTELTLGFSAAISGLSADDITIMPEGAVTKGALGGSGGTYTLGVSGINGETGISVAVSRTGYNITPSSKTVTVHKEAIPVSFTALTANGRANMSSTTKLRLSFSAEIDGFSASNISITPDGAVTKGELSGSGGTYELAVSGISADTEIEVAIIKAGYNVTPSSKTLTVYYVSPNAPWVEDGPGRFVAVSLSNKIAWSSNGGQTWNEISTTRPYSSVAYGDGVFIALPYYSQSAPVQIGGSVAARSTDGGTTWHTVSLPSLVNDALLMEELSKREAVGLVGPLLPKFWKSVAYGNGMFVAVARNSRQAAWSDDGGQSWTAVTMPVDGHFGQESGWKSVTYGNGVFVAVGGHLDWYSAGGNQRGVAAVSADGKTWTRIPYKNAQNEVVGVQDHIAWESVSYGDGVFIAAGGVRAMDAMPYLNNRIARSINGGQNWSSVLLDTIDINDQTAATVNRSAFWMSIAYGDGAFVMVPDASESIEAARPQLPALWSNDNGLTWYRNNNVSSKLPHNSWQSICYGNGRFLTVAKDNRVAWSDDGGRTWEISESMQSENWTCVAYGEP
ncbi:MAG: hypothetical protein LBO04_04105, partial [Spirochaetaceae bacterium]|nr:hypothetical protein [Spirochaetaceae bacterium]